MKTPPNFNNDIKEIIELNMVSEPVATINEKQIDMNMTNE